ncbi:MAG: P-loop NTPase, partial [Candidatus Bathyarchaeia archaeon]
ASGKGGTGKTTLAANIAVSVGSNIQVLDCDVEEPNIHLLLHPKIVDEKPVYKIILSVNEGYVIIVGDARSSAPIKPSSLPRLK